MAIPNQEGKPRFTWKPLAGNNHERRWGGTTMRWSNTRGESQQMRGGSNTPPHTQISLLVVDLVDQIPLSLNLHSPCSLYFSVSLKNRTEHTLRWGRLSCPLLSCFGHFSKESLRLWDTPKEPITIGAAITNNNNSQPISVLTFVISLVLPFV